MVAGSGGARSLEEGAAAVRGPEEGGFPEEGGRGRGGAGGKRVEGETAEQGWAGGAGGWAAVGWVVVAVEAVARA